MPAAAGPVLAWPTATPGQAGWLEQLRSAPLPGQAPFPGAPGLARMELTGGFSRALSTCVSILPGLRDVLAWARSQAWRGPRSWLDPEPSEAAVLQAALGRAVTAMCVMTAG